MPAVQNAQEVFNVLVPDKLAKAPDKAKEVGAVFVFKISGEGGGEWTVDLASATPTCKPGTVPSPNCTIEMANSDFLTMMADQSKGMQLFFSGKLKVSGDQMLAMKLPKVLAF